MTEWKEYTGSDEQIAEMVNAKSGFIAKNVSSVSSIMQVKFNQLFLSGQIDPYLPELFENKLESFLNYNSTTHYLICNPHPLAAMICQQARTGQPVWVSHPAVRYDTEENWGKITVDYIRTYVTTTPDWNIPNAEYRFTPFEEEV